MIEQGDEGGPAGVAPGFSRVHLSTEGRWGLEKRRWVACREDLCAGAQFCGPACRAVSSGARHLDFLRPTRACIGAPRIPGFCPVGLVWNSLDSLVRNEPFQWVTRDPGANFIFQGALSPGRRRKGRPLSIRRSTTLNLLAGRKRLGRPGMMAVDIARVRSGIGIKLTPSSLFGKKLSTRRALYETPTRALAVDAVPAASPPP